MGILFWLAIPNPDFSPQSHSARCYGTALTPVASMRSQARRIQDAGAGSGRSRDSGSWETGRALKSIGIVNLLMGCEADGWAVCRVCSLTGSGCWMAPVWSSAVGDGDMVMVMVGRR